MKNYIPDFAFAKTAALESTFQKDTAAFFESDDINVNLDRRIG